MFRDEDDKYKTLKTDWYLAVSKAHHPGKGILISEVDTLMLASYRLQRYIRRHLNANTSTPVPRVPPLPEALRKAREVMGEKNRLTGLYLEADALEALSRSAYRWLKENNKLVEMP